MTKKIGIISDTHLGFRQYGLEARFHDFFYAVTDAIKKLEEHGIHEILIAGDLLHMARPTARTIAGVRQIHETAKRNGTRILCIRGNHDYTEPHWVSTLEPLRSRESGTLPVGLWEAHDEVVTLPDSGYTVYARGFENPDLFRKIEFPEADILLIHQSIKEFIGYFGGNGLCFAEMPYDKYKMIVVGDTHVPELREHEGCLILSPGSTEMSSSAEPAEKYAWIYDGTDDLRKIVLETRKVISLPTLKTEEDIVSALKEIDKSRKYTDPTTKKVVATGRLLVIAKYDKSVIPWLNQISDFCLRNNIIFRPSLHRSNMQLVARSEHVSTRSLTEIAEQEIQDEDTRELVVRVMAQPEDSASIVDDWTNERLPSKYRTAS